MEHKSTLLSDHIAKNQKLHSIAVFTDIAKAFDSVPIPELVHVIWKSNITPAYKTVITSFVKDRF